MRISLIKIGVGTLVFLLFTHGYAASQWPLWEKFKQYYISSDGRVIDPHPPEKKTTSEGQSYGMFFALINQDQETFDKLLHWTENNLAQGNLAKHLPAWAWGKNTKNKWMILDENSAADSDLWIAYDLLEAGRLWNNKHYTSLGKQLLQRILKEEVVSIPGLGLMLLPGKFGFKSKDSWRLNPSYLPPQLFARFTQLDSKWAALQRNSKRLLIDTSPKGFSPDWVIWKKDHGWQPDTSAPNIGSYNAIRVYLWIGMLAADASLSAHLAPMVALTQKLGAPPEKVDILTGQAQGKGPIGFSAALLPLLANQPEALTVQRQRVDSVDLMLDSYYDSVLRLFGQGWDQNRYRFDAQGKLIVPAI